MVKSFLSTAFLFFVLTSSAQADWFSDTWPAVRERIERLAPKGHGADPMVLDCSPSDELVSPSIDLSADVSFKLSYPDELYQRACDPPESPRYTIYHREGEIIVYSLHEQPLHSLGLYRSVLKEWIYTEDPNMPEGSRYSWNILGAQDVAQDDDGRVHVTAGQAVYTIDPVVYWTRDDAEHAANWQVTTATPGVAVVIDARAEDYPLLIDPTVNYGQWLGADVGGSPTVITSMAYEINNSEIYVGGWTISAEPFSEAVTMAGSIGDDTEGFVLEIADGSTPSLAWGQWLGGSGADEINAVAVSDDEIYAAGYSAQSTGFEAVTFQGAHSGGSEGFVMEITDGGTPSLAWGQWLGGGLADEVNALFVTDEEIYATGYSLQSTGFEAVTFQGAHSGGSEGFVMEITDGGTPSLAWGQWLGGGLADEVNALFVTDEEIYATGYSLQSTGFEAVTFQGAHSGGSEGFVMEITDGGTPSLAWGQWLGGGLDDDVKAFALTDDEIYAGGYSTQSTSFEAVTFQGAHSGGSEGFVIEITDGGTPSLAWGQWLGGSAADDVTALTLLDGEIYAGGYSTQSTSFEAVTFQGAHSGGSEGFVIEITDGGTPSLAWGQWLGGTGNDVIYGLALTDDEIYAGGYSSLSTSFETVSFAGVFSGGSEGFFVEISDGGTPSLNFAQWIGGTGNDIVYAMQVSADQIYAAGYSTVSTSFENLSFQGLHNGGSEGFVVTVSDGLAPVFDWGQWVGASGGGAVTVLAMAVDGAADEVYAAGFSSPEGNWSESTTVYGTYNGDSEGFVVEIADGGTPTLNWLQWIGGRQLDRVLALAVSGDEIYAGGFSNQSTGFEAVTFQGVHSGGTEGFVIEITDAAPPSLAWGQWLGGTASDVVQALSVDGEEIYAGGVSDTSTSWESATSNQGVLASSEGFVVEIADGGTPSLVWRQWLGGNNLDHVYALAVTTDGEIYAGGYSDRSTSWEAVTIQGVHSGGLEGIVIEIGDADPPTLAWGQWLGGGLTDVVFALTVSGGEIYAGGYSTQSTSFEAATANSGLHSGSNEGFVVEITDDTSPSLAWIQWIGGTGSDVVWALAVTDDEIYAGGYATLSSSFESGTFQGLIVASEGFVVEIADGGTPSLAWGQWLGGTGIDTIYALAVTDGEIYAGGLAVASTSFEAVTFAGAHNGTTEGFVVEVGDGGTPSLAWGQWMGGGQAPVTVINAMALNSDNEIYAGGYTTTSTSFETVTFAGSFNAGDTEAFIVEIATGVTPTLSWGQWLGGGLVDVISAVAVTGDEIYAGGYSTQSTGWEAVLSGVHSGGLEGFVVEITDAVAPSLSWGQWIGGPSSDQVLALAVTGEEIYAGGYSLQSTSIETGAVNTGAFTGAGSEGFVIEITDGGSPALAWFQWLGGTGNDAVFALAVTDDEIYAGGYSGSSAAGFSEAVTFQGTYSAAAAVSEGFVVEIGDSGTPTLEWGQWLGGTSTDHVYALAVIADEIYAGGYATLSTSFEAVTFTGTFSGGIEGFLVEISDGVTPSLVWAQWLGGTGNDNVFSIALEGENVYAGGYASASTSFEAGDFIKGADGGGEEGFVAQMIDGVTPKFSSLTWYGGTSNDRVLAIQAATGIVYAAGYATLSTSFEAFTFYGTHASVTEGFVAEVAIPTVELSWGQFAGGGPLISNDRINALVVSGDEIYAGGVSDRSTNWESVTFQGAHSGQSEGFVIEIADAGAPSLAWGQWFGGALVDEVTALAVNGEEVYAGGYSTQSTGWEAVLTGVHSGGSEGFVVEITDGGTPSLSWGQWFGGAAAEFITGLKVTDDEIYAAGYSTSTTVGQFEAVTFQGTFGAGAAVNEGFVIEIGDGGTPSLVWGHWIGGDNNDQVLALGIINDEIYVGGYSAQSTGFEAVTFQGLHSGSSEGFVVEIVDGGTPALSWGQWLGGSSDDVVRALAVSGDEIYAGGYSASSTSFEAATFQGLHSGSSEGFVVEIVDGGTPTLSWGQWIGGSGADDVNALSVVNTEIYAGGYSVQSTGFEAFTFTGLHSGSSEGFMVEIRDGATIPTATWGQWFGGSTADVILTVATTGDEVYAGGYSVSSTSFEAITFTGAFSGGTEGFLIEVVDDVSAGSVTDTIFYDQMF